MPAPPCCPSAGWFLRHVHAHDAVLRRHLRAHFPGLRDQEDVLQEAYLRVWRHCRKRTIVSAKAFLFAVARNVARDRLRRERASPVIAVTELARMRVCAGGRGTAELAAIRQEHDCLLEAIAALPARCRAVVLLRKRDGLSPAATAGLLGIAEGTVHIHARRGVLRVRRFLADRGIRREIPVSANAGSLV